LRIGAAFLVPDKGPSRGFHFDRGGQASDAMGQPGKQRYFLKMGTAPIRERFYKFPAS